MDKLKEFTNQFVLTRKSDLYKVRNSDIIFDIFNNITNIQGCSSNMCMWNEKQKFLYIIDYLISREMSIIDSLSTFYTFDNKTLEEMFENTKLF